MRITALTVLAAAGFTLSLSACTQPMGMTPAPIAQTGSQQTAPDTGGVTFQDPSQAPGVGAYTGSQHGSNSPLGVTYQDPSHAPGVGAYTGSQRGYSSSPLSFQRNPSGSSTPIEQPPVAPMQ